MTAWGRGQAHIPRRAGGERFVIPSFPAGVCLALPIVCVLDAGFILDALPSLALASCLWYRLQVRQKCDRSATTARNARE